MVLTVIGRWLQRRWCKAVQGAFTWLVAVGRNVSWLKYYCCSFGQLWRIFCSFSTLIYPLLSWIYCLFRYLFMLWFRLQFLLLNMIFQLFIVILVVRMIFLLFNFSFIFALGIIFSFSISFSHLNLICHTILLLH